MKKYLIFILFMMPWFANATTAYTWNGKPINIMLQVGHERIVRFPDNVMYKYNKDAVGNAISMTTAAGILYITPKVELKNFPVDVKLVGTGEIIKLRLTAVNSKQSLDEVRIFPPVEERAKTSFSQSSQDIGQNRDFADRSQGDPISLIRYAAMRDMMPKRLWKSNPAISSIPMPKGVSLKELFLGRMAGVFDAQITASYRSGNLVLTAIALRNTTPYPVAIDFRDISIQTEFVSVPKPYYTLGPKDSRNQSDYGVMYVVTKGPFLPYLLQVDPNALLNDKGGKND